MDWRDVCKQLGDRWGYQDGVLTLPGHTIRFNPNSGADLKEDESRLFSCSPLNAEFAAAVALYRDGSDARLQDYLYSDRPLGDPERLVLAELLALPPKDVRLEHKQSVRFAAGMARAFYKELCDECRSLGVRTWGEAKNMQRRCAEAVALFVEGVTAGEVLDVMGRADSRRSLGDEGAVIVFGPMTVRLVRKFPRQK